MTALRVVCGLVLTTLVACGGGGDDARADYRQFPLASGAVIDKISLYQGVERSLYNVTGDRAGGLAPPPVIEGRDAMLRVYVSPEEIGAFSGRPLAVVLEVVRPTSVDVVSQSVVVWGSWTENMLGSTANFRIPGDQISQDMSFKVTVRETTPLTYGTVDEEAVSWSADAAELTVRPSGDIVLRLVPVEYAADGSGRTPDMSEEAVARYRDLVQAVFPAANVDVRVEPPLRHAARIGSSSGLEGLLSSIASLRASANPPANHYFYGLVNPAPTFGEFCQGGCTTGLSSVPGVPSDGWARVSVGVGYVDNGAPETLIHELGHAHGRAHAPCGGPAGVDRNYPYPNATILAWGYDVVQHRLLDPANYVDMMSYCSPTWVSDYTFTALRSWIEQVQALTVTRSHDARMDWQMLQVSPSGEAALGEVVALSTDPGGVPVMVDLLDAAGEMVDQVPGVFMPFDHSDGGLALIEPPGHPVVAAQVP